MEFKKKHLMKILMILVVTVVVIPIIIYLLAVLPILPNGGNDWAGFWGGYLGAIIGGIITLCVMHVTITSENKTRKREEKIQFFNQITSLYACGEDAAMSFANMIMGDVFKTKERSYDEILNASNVYVRYFSELEMLLKTRKREYDVNDLIFAINALGQLCNGLLKEYENYPQSQKTDMEKQKETKKYANDIADVASKVEKIVISTIESNLKV